MRKLTILVIASLMTFSGFAQNKTERAVLVAMRSVHNAIFVNKDSVALDALFAPEVSYGHSGGKLEDRATAIHNAGANKSTYSGITATQMWVMVSKKTAVTRYMLDGTETKSNGTASPLHLHIMQTWVKRNGKWLMLARQAVHV